MFDRDFCPNLRELNLSHNFFASLRGFGYLPNLRILKIKQNRLESLFCKLNDDGYPRGLFGLHGLRQIDPNSFHNQLIISCLKLEDNGLRSLANIERLERLQAFHGGGNRLAEFWEVDRLAELVYLMEISLMNNPMTRKP